jgi:hypothetical protein
MVLAVGFFCPALASPPSPSPLASRHQRPSSTHLNLHVQTRMQETGLLLAGRLCPRLDVIRLRAADLQSRSGVIHHRGHGLGMLALLSESLKIIPEQRGLLPRSHPLLACACSPQAGQVLSS